MTGPYSTVLTPQFISQYSGHDPTLSLVFIYIYIHTVWQVAGLEEQVAQAVAARDALQLLLTAAQVLFTNPLVVWYYSCPVVVQIQQL